MLEIVLIIVNIFSVAGDFLTNYKCFSLAEDSRLWPWFSNLASCIIVIVAFFINRNAIIKVVEIVDYLFFRQLSLKFSKSWENPLFLNIKVIIYSTLFSLCFLLSGLLIVFILTILLELLKLLAWRVVSVLTLELLIL